MSFKDGYSAIAQIQSSGQKLGEIIDRIEALEKMLADLRQAQIQVENMIGQGTAVLADIELATVELLKLHASFDLLAKNLPDATETVLAHAEERITKQHALIASMVEEIPAAIEQVVDQKLTILMSQLETRISDRLRDELKDTRMALRDAMEVNSRAHDAKLDAASKEIIAEMPRSLLGRRGRG